MLQKKIIRREEIIIKAHHKGKKYIPEPCTIPNSDHAIRQLTGSI